MITFEEHSVMVAEFSDFLQKQGEEKYGDNRILVNAHEAGYLHGTLQSLWSCLNLSEEQKELFAKYLKTHSS